MRWSWTVWAALGLAATILAACASAGSPPPEAAARCAAAPAWIQAAAAETAALYTVDLVPFGRPEHGWAVYAPLASRELGLPCPPGTAAFAQDLAAWQGAHGLPASGVMDAATFDALKSLWQGRRPFVALRAKDICPEPPPASDLVLARADETAGKPVQARRRVLRAYRRMVRAARRDLPALAADPEALRIFSAFRSPTYDGERCAREANCDGIVRAQCSAHRTGLALDLMVGAAPGFAVDSSDDANRLYQSRTGAYRWLVANAARFGFVSYPFEPWHWEWTGEPVVR